MTRMIEGTAGIERDSARISKRANVLAVIAACFALLTALLGFTSLLLNNARSDLNTQVQRLEADKEDLHAELIVANERVDSRDEDIDRLEREIQELQLYAPEVPSGGTHEIRMAATVTLAAGGDSIKLDSGLPQFDLGRRTSGGSEVTYNGESLSVGAGYLFNRPDFVTLAAGQANYDSCSVAQGWAGRSTFDPLELTATDVCLRLKDGRFAVIHVVSFEKTSITLQATVWE